MFRVCKIVTVRQKTGDWLRQYGSATLLAVAVLAGLLAGALFPSDGLPAVRSFVLGWPAEYLVIAPFFFLVGLELRREFSHGALKPIRNASSPFLAACLGVALPALWYLVLNHGAAAAAGWPIPTATDVTFALVVYTAFGSALPRGARTFLLAFAVIDDLIAVLLITLVFGFSADSGFAELIPVALAFVIPLRWPTRVEKHLLTYLNLVGLPLFAFFMSAVNLPPLAVMASSLIFWGVVLRPVWKWAGVFIGGLIGQRWATGEMRVGTKVLARVALLGGIGFTVSLLVAGIAFKADGEAFAAALLATFIASGASALVAAVALVRSHRS